MQGKEVIALTADSLGNLYLQDGMWNGGRILPEGYAKFVSTLAPDIHPARAVAIRDVDVTPEKL